MSDHYPPVLGGIETHVSTLAAHQSALGHQIEVLTSGRPSVTEGGRVRAGTVPVHRVRYARDVVVSDLASYDVLHAHVSVVAPFTAPLAAAAARRGVPTIVTVHSLWNGMGPLPAAAAQVAGLRTAPVQWTSVSRLAASVLVSRLPPGTDVEVLTNAVCVSPRATTPAGRPGGALRLVSTMRLAGRKRPTALLRIFDTLCRTVAQPLELILVGEGPRRAEVERWLGRSSIRDRVVLTGRLESGQVWDELSHADIYVAPAVLESFGLAALEARTVGLPVVGRDRTGLTEFIRHGEEGLLCRSDAHMVSELRRLIQDPGLRPNMSEHNRTTRPVHTWSHTLARHEELYAQMLDHSRRSRQSRLLAAP